MMSKMEKINLFSREEKKYVPKNWTEIAQVLSTPNLYTEGNKPMKMLKNYLFIQEKDYTNPDFKFRCETEYLARENLDWWQRINGNDEQSSFVCFKDGKMELNIPMLFETKEKDQTLWKQCQSKLQQSQPYSADANKKGELGEQFRGVINRYTKCLSKRKSDLLDKAFGHKQQQEVPDRNVVFNYLPTNDLSAINTDTPAHQDIEEMETDVKIQETQIATLVLIPVEQFGNITTSNLIDQVKLAEYKRSHPYFNWEIIFENLNKVNSPENEKRNLMHSLLNEWFVNENEDLFVSYDLNCIPAEEVMWWESRIQENWSRFAQLEKGVLIISIPKLFTESRGEKGEVREKLKGALEQENRTNDSSIQTHLTRYVKKLSKRKNDFINAIILNNKFHTEQQTNVPNFGSYFPMENLQTSFMAQGEQMAYEYQQYAPDASGKSDQMEIGAVDMEWTNPSAEISN